MCRRLEAGHGDGPVRHAARHVQPVDPAAGEPARGGHGRPAGQHGQDHSGQLAPAPGGLQDRPIGQLSVNWDVGVQGGGRGGVTKIITT